MSWTAVVVWSLVRAVVIATLLIPVLGWLEAWLLGREPGRSQERRWLAVVIPFLMPELVIGYSFVPWVAGRPVWAELAGGVILACRAIPIGLVAHQLTPPSALGASAAALAATIPANPLKQALARARWRDRWFAEWGPAWTLMVLVLFQTFELSALLRTVSWVDWLFVQQKEGLSLLISWRLALLPVGIQAVLLSLVPWMLRDRLRGRFLGRTGISRRTDAVPSARSSTTVGASAPAEAATGAGIDPPSPQEAQPRTLSHSLSLSPETFTGWAIVAGLWLVLIVVPVATLMTGWPLGMVQLIQQPTRWLGLGRELLVGLLISATAALLTWTAVGGLERRALKNWPLHRLLVLPGLCGTLLVGLTCLAVFQHAAWAWAYDTPLPWLTGLMIGLWPKAWLLQAWTDRTERTDRGVLTLLEASPDPAVSRQAARLRWKFEGLPQVRALAVLAWWAYLDLTSGYLLAPTGMTPGIVRLYNFLHFGQTAALSAEVTILVGVPLLLGWWTLHWFDRTGA